MKLSRKQASNPQQSRGIGKERGDKTKEKRKMTEEESAKKINEDLLKDYVEIKIGLKELQEKEGKLREQLLKELDSINQDEYETDYVKIFKMIQKRIFYPKAELEKQVPEELLRKIRQEKKIICLISKLK